MFAQVCLVRGFMVAVRGITTDTQSSHSCLLHLPVDFSLVTLYQHSAYFKLLYVVRKMKLLVRK